ncbi:unnamed protein product, partial [Owenia fusiformis]
KMEGTGKVFSNENDVNFVNNNEPNDIQWKPISLTYVEYPSGDLLGKALAWCSLIPIFLLVSFATLIIFRRDLHTICYLAGIVSNEGVNWLLKHTIKEARPSKDKRILYTEYGMPSSHSQFMWFFTSYLILFVLVRIYKNSSLFDELWKYAVSALALVASTAVCYSRVYLGYHTIRQVLWGGVTGSTLGIFWFIMVQFVFTPLFPTIAAWPISEHLMLRDSTLIPNVMWFEYTSSRVEAKRRLRKSKSN